MKNQLLMLSMPNNGSDWLAKTITNSQNECKYFREFFNPATNTKYSDILGEEFGCEYINFYKNIISFDCSSCEHIYNKTWKQENYNFTKENYSFFKAGFYIQNFNCFALIRKIENSLPANRRAEVTGWYLSIYESLLYNKIYFPELIQVKIDHFNSKKTRIDEKVTFAFCIYQELLIATCNQYKIPVLQYEDLFDCDNEQLNKILIKLKTDIDCKYWADEIEKTRKKTLHNFHILDCNWVVATYYPNDYKYLFTKLFV
jgi:hypothetical protein